MSAVHRYAAMTSDRAAARRGYIARVGGVNDHFG